MIWKPKHLILFTTLKSVDDNGTVCRINEGVQAQAKRKKIDRYLKVTSIYKSTAAWSLSLQHAKYNGKG